MEEQKNKAKEVKMGSVEGKQQKLTYDQLKEVADKLWNENRYLRQQLQQATDFAGTVKRLDYLFKVVELASQYTSKIEYPCFTREFVESCLAEIEEALTVPEETEKAEEN
jgi:hypothetical protein